MSESIEPTLPGPWGPVRYRLADIGIGAKLMVSVPLAHNISQHDLGYTESIVVLGHGSGSLPFSLVRTDDGREIKIIDEDVEPAIQAIDES